MLKEIARANTLLMFIVNAYLVETGLAKAKMVPPNYKHMFLFERLEREVRRKKRGIWSLVKRS